MNRTGLAIALSIAALTGVAFAVAPQLDLAISQPFYDPVQKDFPLRFAPILGWLRAAVSWIVALLVAPAALAVVGKLIWPRKRMLIPGRAALFLIATLILGPGLLVNVIMKDHWPRSRPIDVPQFSGSETFVPWWDPRGVCPKNCSFVAGESAGAFWSLAPAALAPVPWRPLAYAAAIAFGSAAGALRIAFGGHFFTDVVFAGVLMFLLVWIVHGVIYRWLATRLSDAAVEQALERAASPVHRALGKLTARIANLRQQQPRHPS
jgi:membrane-associated PAP2 superfamily phosphatase